MATARLSSDDLLHAIERLGVREAERIAFQLLALRAQRLAANLSAEETRLMSEINQGLAPERAVLYESLMARRRMGTLTESEQEDLRGLTDEAERLQARRIEALSELSRLRGTSLRSLMDELELQPAANG